MEIFDKVEQLIGNTPLYMPKKLLEKLNIKCKIYLKLESFNPAGSIKDRVAFYMLDKAKKQGKISDGATIIEPTSGNTGIGLACICASLGYKLILTMPNTMSEERCAMLRAYGAQLVLTDGKLGMSGAIEKAKQIQAKTPNSFIPSQFDNPFNPLAHYETTAPEIYQALNGKINYFVAGIGTGGTISGCAKFFKEKDEKINIIGVEPYSSPLITKGVSGVHKLQGIGANFVPKNYNETLIDQVVAVKDDDAFFYAKMLAKEEGLLVGITSGAILSAAVEIARKKENDGKTIVAIMPDSGNRYLSTGLFE